ncbi:agmatine deiminase family protein [Phenylobacterium sp. NIBR 498073]|uniref:agmatine deiminase family protein n=1 Tax=Phenylobacterium sp. NIBR 498073 TaxID=3015177 RepID=UPI0022B3E332|nr:agmatine deiminase family protein [Phenylobacterium sp. NIBR 498073]WGU39960.1 agmatine deiminase family protein [Phenylobacterium sp. NIBR 498073]
MTVLVPAEWAPHRAMWLGFPSHEDLWEDDLPQAQEEVAALARALAGPGAERVRLLTGSPAGEADARRLLGDVAGIEIVPGRFGDIWLRDTGPIFAKQGGADVAQGFRFNGWGGKYQLDHDDEVAAQIAQASGVPLNPHDFILEGGAVDHDGAGTVLTTGQCVLNPNRNPGWTQGAAEAAFAQAFGATKTIWLGEGLANDHTDGHVDNLARFVAPGVAVCPVGFGRGDVNIEAYDDAARRLAEATDAQGRKLKVVRIPSPGWIEGAEGKAAPASHMNFIIANGAVIMPTYGEGQAADLALQALESVFPDRKIIGLPSMAILTGGGSFHCITQQEPA